MSALARQLRDFNSPAATAIRAIATTINWALFIPGAEAAARLGTQRDHFTRLCRDKLQHQGMAILATPPAGGQERWFVRRDYDPRLSASDASAANWIASDLSGFTAKQRETALARRACVEELRRARTTWPGAVKDWLPRLLAQLAERFKMPVSKSALHEWDKKYNCPADLAKLIDARGGDRSEGADAAAWGAFADLFLHANQPSVRQVWALVGGMAKEKGWRWCSLFSCRRQLDNRIPPEVQLKHRWPAKWRQTLRPFIAQDPEGWAAGECWVGDHKQLDLICRWRDSLIRPWLTAWMDQRTRRIVGHTLSDTPDSRTILAALGDGILDQRNHGGPRAVWIDNGRDYDAWLFHGQTKRQRRERLRVAVDEPQTHGIFSLLQIEAHFSIVENPNGKRNIERWFRTLENFCRMFDTYTGDAPDTKPERLNEIIAARHRVPTFETIHERLTAHIAGYNASADHGIDDLLDDADGQRLSPDEAMERWCSTRRIMRDPAAVKLLLAHWHQPVTVGRNGITLTIRGRALHYGQFEPALTPFKAPLKADRRTVNVAYDDADLRRVRVHDEHFRYVCAVEMNGVGGLHGGDPISVEHVGEMIRNQRTYERGLKHQAEHSLTQCMTAEERAAEIAAKSPRRRPAAAAERPAALRMIQTPLDGQAAAVARDELRVAVGAESRSAPMRSPSHALPALSRWRQNNNTPPPTRREPEPFENPLAKLRERKP